MIRSLQLIDPEILSNGTLAEWWFHITKERSYWDELIESLDPQDEDFNSTLNFAPDSYSTPEPDNEAQVNHIRYNLTKTGEHCDDEIHPGPAQGIEEI